MPGKKNKTLSQYSVQCTLLVEQHVLLPRPDDSRDWSSRGSAFFTSHFRPFTVCIRIPSEKQQTKHAQQVCQCKFSSTKETVNCKHLLNKWYYNSLQQIRLDMLWWYSQWCGHTSYGNKWRQETGGSKQFWQHWSKKEPHLSVKYQPILSLESYSMKTVYLNAKLTIIMPIMLDLYKVQLWVLSQVSQNQQLTSH